jgi:hypothetical protein
MDAQAERIILIDAAALDEQRQWTKDAAGQLGDIGTLREGGRRVVALDDQGQGRRRQGEFALYF